MKRANITLNQLVSLGLASAGFQPSMAQQIIEEDRAMNRVADCPSPYNTSVSLCLDPAELCRLAARAVKPFYTENARVLTSNISNLKSFKSFYSMMNVLEGMSTDLAGPGDAVLSVAAAATVSPSFENILNAVGFSVDFILPAEVKAAAGIKVVLSGFTSSMEEYPIIEEVSLQLTGNNSRLIGLFGVDRGGQTDPIICAARGLETSKITVTGLPAGTQVTAALIARLDKDFPLLVQTVYQDVLANG